jgi:hypothetical protein
MTSVVFVHGTGTREPAYTNTFNRIERKLQGVFPQVKAVPCYWGGELGARLHHDGASIPLYDSTRATESLLEEEDYEIALWEQLYRDPLYELRILANMPAQEKDFVPGGPTQGEELDECVKNLKVVNLILQKQLKEANIATILDDAKITVTDSLPYIDAIKTLVDETNASTFRMALARAIVATAIIEGEQQSLLTTDANLRDEIIRLLSRELGADERAPVLVNWVARQVAGLALSIVTGQVRRKRGALSDATSPIAGDILVYQGNGEKIRAFIRQVIEEAEAPIILLAHSLGGIACTDLLVQESLPKVKALITVGSQVSYFYEINALYSLRYNNPLPEHFPPWLNIYDLRDFLSYICAGAFKRGVQDILVDSRQPFPQSHGSYWANDAVWKAVKERL